MRILFICRANVGRSQMAEAIFEKLCKDHKAVSCGLNPGKWEGTKISETKYVGKCLNEIGCSVDGKVSKRINREMVESADKIIVIGEKDDWPEYLREEDVEYWDIEDPAYKGLEGHRETRDEIFKLVERFIDKLELT